MPGIARHTPQLSGTEVVRALRIDVALLSHVGELITQLTDPDQWVEIEDTIADVIDAAWLVVESYYGAIMVGQISAFLGTLPPGWLFLDGSTVNQQDYPELTDVIDTQYRNDVAETITFPDVRGRFLAGADGTSALGSMGGLSTVQLTEAQVPSHTHTYTLPVQGADIGGAGPPMPAVSTTTPGTPTGSAGGDQAHENKPPYISVNWAIFAGR